MRSVATLRTFHYTSKCNTRCNSAMDIIISPIVRLQKERRFLEIHLGSTTAAFTKTMKNCGNVNEHTISHDGYECMFSSTLL